MPEPYGTCRACGEKLLRAEHVRFGKVDTAAEEKASGVPREYDGGEVYSWIHTACPHCNEPRPLSRKWRGWLLIAAFAALFGFAVWVEFA